MHQKDVLLGVVVVLVLVVVALVSCCLFSEDPSSNSVVMWLAVVASGLVLAAGGIASWDEKMHKAHDTQVARDTLREAAAARGDLSDYGRDMFQIEDTSADPEPDAYSFYGA